ncbi:DUF167 domain-containing protein [Methanoregula sp.]|jgi:uncharacterized protein (TIGR00251 family)|uniref:DUF167 domain-containing protein n=1 Tax=Methanoregula sp. TaxID=2052170 RepID=UPI003C1D4005
MSTIADAISEDSGNTLLHIEVSAGAKSDLFPAGFNAWRNTIGCRVTAPAVNGKANKAVIGLISSTTGVPVSAVSIVSGLTSSQKKIRIVGVSKVEINRILVENGKEKDQRHL